MLAHRTGSRIDDGHRDEWDEYHPQLDPEERFRLFLEECLAEVQAGEPLTSQRLCVFGQIWTSPDFLGHCSSFWEMVFHLQNYSRDLTAAMIDSERAAWESLPPVVTVHRGYRDGLRDGYCWYLDRQVAVAWAAGNPNYGMLSSGRIAKPRVRALFTRRGEVELIVDGREVEVDVTTSHGGSTNH